MCSRQNSAIYRARVVRQFPLVISLLFFSTYAAEATILIQGDANFQAAVDACREKFNDSDPETKTIIDGLKTPPAVHVHTIKKSDGSNNTDYDNENDANDAAVGGTGSGTGTTINWNPNNTDPYGDGTKRDPCASLLHELRHALDGEKGGRDPRIDGPTGIKTNEIEASKEENRYRKKHGLPQRKKYGRKDLPPRAKFYF